MNWLLVSNNQDSIVELPDHIVNGCWHLAQANNQNFIFRVLKNKNILQIQNGLLIENYQIRNISFNPQRNGSTLVNLEYYNPHQQNSKHLKIKVQLDTPLKLDQLQATNQQEQVVESPMNGKVLKVHAKNNQKVTEGEILLIIEAMKMENNISSPCTGVIINLNIKEGDLVVLNQSLLTIKPNN